jgi:hypothetical protein
MLPARGDVVISRGVADVMETQNGAVRQKREAFFQLQEKIYQ